MPLVVGIESYAYQGVRIEMCVVVVRVGVVVRMMADEHTK